jgi:hypothetical protein
VSRVRNTFYTDGGESPARESAKNKDKGNIFWMSNATSRDAAAA